MARALRLQFEDALYHVCARGNRREPIYRDDKDFSRFEDLLAESLTRYQVELHAYVLLGNHFHLLARTRKANLSRWMQWLITSYSVWFNRRYRLSGHLFQGRFKSFLVQENEYLVELSRYIHLNPVRGRVVGCGDPATRRQRLRSYRWSSYRGYAGLARQREFVIEELVLREFGGTGRKQQSQKLRYRRFVEKGLLREIENPFEQVRWQTVLGNESFVRRLSDRLKSQRRQQREASRSRHPLHTTEAKELIKRVADHYGIEPRALLGKRIHGSQARNVAMWLLRQRGAVSLREIGQLFGGIDHAAVSQRIGRLEKKIAEQKELHRTCEMLNV